MREAVEVSLEGCDEALALLRDVARDGSVAEQLLAWAAIDEILDRRNELVLLEGARMGAQS